MFGVLARLALLATRAAFYPSRQAEIRGTLRAMRRIPADLYADLGIADGDLSARAAASVDAARARRRAAAAAERDALKNFARKRRLDQNPASVRTG